MIHVEREVKQTKTQTQRKLQDEEDLEVGMTYLLRFVSLYRKPNQVLQAIFYYRNLVLESLPSWMQIDRENQSDPNLQSVIEVNIPKECLDSEDSKKSLLILVIKTCFQLDQDSFIYTSDEVTTTQEESLLIYKYLKSNGFINGSNCVTDFFDSTQDQYIDLSDTFKGITIDESRLKIIQLYASETLKRSIAYNQFVFNVISSLKFNQSNPNSMITAIQSYISIHFSFPQNSPYIFIQKVYPNVIIYFNDEQTIMKMEGDISYINSALSEKILYFDSHNSTTSQSSSNNKISIVVMDYFNFDLSYDFNVPDQVKFLKEKSEIKQVKNLQDQVDKQYSDAQLTIEEAFLIEFDKKTFEDPDGVALSYQFQEEVSGQYLQLSSDSFIKYDNANLRLVGTPPSSYLFTTYHLRLVVTNGYNSISADFYIKLSKMPFSYVFNKVIQILGPIAFVFGMYQKRSTFMNIYFKSNTMYSTEVAQVNQMYRKKIAILGYDYEIANLFLMKFIKSSGRQLQKSNTLQFEQSQNFNNVTGTKKTAQDVISPRNDSNYQHSQQNFQIPMSTRREMLSPQQSETILPQISNEAEKLYFQNNNDQQIISPKQIAIKFDKNDQTKNQLNQLPSKTSIPVATNQETQPNSAKIKLRKYINVIKFLKSKKEPNSSIMIGNKQEKEQVNNTNNYGQEQDVQPNANVNLDNKYQFIKNIIQSDDDSFSMDRLFNLMVSQKIKILFNLQNYSIEDYVIEIQNQYSRFYHCLKANVMRYLLDNDDKTNYLYKFMKRYAIQSGEYSQNDWYKSYVSVVATNEIDRYGIPVPFSKTILKEDKVYEVLKILELIPQELERSKFDIKTLFQHQINPYLLREVIFADALGLQFVSTKSILKCSGESLHLENHTIVSVEANKLVEQGHCLCLRKPFNLNYQTLPISKYNSLPSWMSYDYKNGVIILEGIPSKLDVNHILIRVYDNIQFACFQFHLKIEDTSNSIAAADDDKNSPAEIQQNEDNKSQFLSENKLLQSSLSFHRPKASSITAQNSIFKVAQLLKNKRKDSPISEIKSEEKSSSKQNELDEYENQDEIEEQAYKGVKSMTEFDIGLNSPPLFPHQMELKEKENPVNLKLNFEMPPLIPMPMLKQNLLVNNYLKEIKTIKYAESFCEQSNNSNSPENEKQEKNQHDFGKQPLD